MACGSMSAFHFFWDKPAGLLNAACVMSPGDREAFVLVTRRSGPVSEPLAVVAVQHCPKNLASTFAIPVPEGESSQTVYEFRLVTPFATVRDPSASLVRICLDGASEQAPEIAQQVAWTVRDGVEGPKLEFNWLADDISSHGLLSPIRVSGRDGNVVYPQHVVEDAGPNRTIQVSTNWALPAPVTEADGAIVQSNEPVVHMALEPTGAGAARETEFKAFSLMVGNHVLPMLTDKDFRIDFKDCNYHLIRLGAGSAATKVEFPKPGDEGFPLGYMDRIVIVTTPPARLEHIEGERSHPFGRSGIGILSYGRDGFFFPDDGALLEQILTKWMRANVDRTADFIRALTFHKMTAKRTDLNRVSEISILVASSSGHRISNWISALSPMNVGEFSLRPQFYANLAALSGETLAPDALARLASAQSMDCRDSHDLFGRLLLERTIEAEADSRVAARLRLWMDETDTSGYMILAVAMSSHLQRAIASGVSPAWADIEHLCVENLATLTRLGSLLTDLTAAEIVPFDYASQFCSFSDVRLRISNLEQLREAAFDLHKVVQLRLLDADLPDTEREEFMAEVADQRAGMPIRRYRTQVASVERSVRNFAVELKLLGQRTGSTKRIASLVCRKITDHMAHIQSFIDVGFSDPTGSPEPVSSFEMMDAQTGFERHDNLPDAAVEWLMAKSYVPPIVAPWKSQLRREFESRKKSGRVL